MRIILPTAALAGLLLIGGCSASEKNYRELERDSGDPFQTERDPLFQSNAASQDAAVIARATDETPGGQTEEGADGADAVSPGTIEIIRTDEPSITGLDRSHWPTVTFSAAQGLTVHGPAYLGGRTTADRTRLQGASATQQFEAALAGADAGNLSAGNLGTALLEPVWLAADVVTLPVRLITQPPLRSVTSPSLTTGSAGSASR